MASAAAEVLAGSVFVGASRLYETDPVGPPQPRYLNAALLVRTVEPPGALLTRLLRVERRLGRERRERWGPRTIDLDVLWGRGLVVREPGLRVPHERLGERPFALIPLLDVSPEAADPSSGRSYRSILSELDRSGVRRVGDENWYPRP